MPTKADGTIVERKPRHTSKTLVVKQVISDLGKRCNVPIPPLHQLVTAIFEKGGTVGARHHPKVETRKQLARCAFLQRANKDTQGVRVVHACSYRFGVTSDLLEESFAAAEATIRSADSERTDQEIEHCSFLAFGDIIIIESSHGFGGAMALAKLLTALGRKHFDKNLATIRFADVILDDLRREIDAGGGVVQATAMLSLPDSQDFNRFAKLLSDARRKFNGANQIRVEWSAGNEANEPMSTDDAVSLFDEDEVDLANVSLKLKNGPVIADLSRYTEKRHVDVQVTAAGQIVRSEIETQLVDYLTALMTDGDDRSRLIDENGVLRNRKLAGVP